MSQTFEKIKQIAKLIKSGESTSSNKVQSWTIRDSRPCRNRMTNNLANSSRITTGTFTGLITLSAAFIAPLLYTSDTHATQSSLSVTVTAGANPSISIAPSAEGRFAATSAATFGVSTTHAAGYVITATSTALTDNTNSISSFLKPSDAAGVTAANYADSDYTYDTASETGKNLNNTWGFKPSKYYDTANETTVDNTSASTGLFLPAPTTAVTLDKTTTATNNNYDISVGARVTDATAISTYSAVMTVAVTPNVTPYTIAYNANAGTDTVTNMPANVTNGEANGETIQIDGTTIPERENYEFKGWCSVSTNDDTCPSNVIYNPDGKGTNLTYTIDQTSDTNDITVHAIWREIASIVLYDAVKAAWTAEGSRVLANSTAAVGIMTNPTVKTSGIFKYNPTTFGIASDASNTSAIYFYRGILDNTVGTYGSDGDNEAHPNTVLLDANKNGADTSDTCWRIVRTTGSGGVKLIYQGKYGATTSGSCANSADNAQLTTKAFSGTYSTYRQIVRVGYTYNSTYATNTSQSGTIAQIFGTNSNPAANNTRSDIKTYIEDTWYANNMTNFTSKLEASAGYCNDRTMNTTTSWTTPLAETSTIASTYGTSNQQNYDFGAYPRNYDTAQPPTLACGNKYSQIDRSTVDLYRYASSSTGVSNQLKYPVALLTADEVSFAGSGQSPATRGSGYHANSYLCSGSTFWLLSPYARYSTGDASMYFLYSTGDLGAGRVDGSRYGVRPAISLASGTSATSGSGTATDPWVVTP